MKRVIPLLILAVLLLSSCVIVNYTLCTVRFETDGGTPVPDQEVIKGKKAVEPKSPEKEKYTFLYWTLDGKKYEFSTPVEKDITLKAQYQGNTSLEELVIEAKRIYSIADILVNKTTFADGEDVSNAFSSTDDAALLLATALNIHEDQIYIEVNNEEVVYDSSKHKFTLSEKTLAKNESQSTANTKRIVLEDLFLKGKYENKNTMEIIYNDSREITFNSIDIEWNDGTEITGTVKLKVNNSNLSTLTFTSDGTKMISATYGGRDITNNL